MNQWRTCACVLGALLLTGCTAAGAAEHAASHATGQCRPGDGSRDRQAAHRRRADRSRRAAARRAADSGHGDLHRGRTPAGPVGVGASGKFSAWLPPGRYHVAGRSPDIETVTDSGQYLEQTCSQPLSVTVSARHAAAISVVCIVP